MTWAFRRQIFYVFILILLLALGGYLIAYPSLNQAPSCMDNKQNGNETGIDCGGSCSTFCTSQADPISILWTRSFQVVLGRYNAVAYLENHNKNAVINKINYRFTFRDANHIYIGKRDGTTYIPPAGKFAIFEPAIDIGNSIPIYTEFAFTEPQNWIQVSQDKINQFQVLVSSINLLDETTAPKISALIKNNSLFAIPEINVVVILYDNLGNAISASRTYLSTLLGGESRSINFTWPEPFKGKVVVKEIIPMYDFWSQLK